ncbi:MAG: hypothetical protein KBA95_09145 [Acidobacteria bacterium]|nr:hypothetical protein [Acidobacteriota bacterium]
MEQILPTLATKEDLKPLATKEELKALATKEELKALATKEELREAVAKLATRLREEGERSRRYMKILIEDVKDTIALDAERLTAVDERDAKQHAESVEADQALDRRVTALEAASRRRRRQTGR